MLISRNQVLVLVSILILGVFVSGIKYKCVFANKELKKIQIEINKLNDELLIFNAEWSYLNHPNNLKKLAAKYLPNLRPVESNQVMSYNSFCNAEFHSINNKKLNNLLDSIL